MYPVNDDFIAESLKKDRELQAKIVIGGTKVFDDTSIVGFSIVDSITSKDDFILGEAVSSKLTASIRTKILLSDGEKIEPFLRFKTATGFTDYIPLGVFTIDSRVNKNNVWDIVAYDDLTALLIPYESELEFPATMVDVMNEIKTQTGLIFDNTIQINPEYTIAYNNNTDAPTIRDVIRWIAGVHLCSTRMTKDGKLSWVKFTPSPSVTTDIPRSLYFKLDKLNEIRTITKVIVTNSTEGEVVYTEKGSGGAYNTVTFENPYMTPEYLDAVFEQINGFSYVPYTLSMRGLPYLEVADAISFQRDESLTWLDIEIPWENYDIPWDGLVSYNSLILSSELIYRKGLMQNISAKSRSEKENEYEFTGTLDKEIKRLKRNSVQENKLYNGVKITRNSGIDVIRSDGKVEVNMSATDGFRIMSDRGQGYLEDVLYLDTEGNLKLISEDMVTFESLKTSGATIINGSNITTGTLDASQVSVIKLNASNITTGTLSASRIDVQNLKVKHLDGADGTFSGELKAASGTFSGTLSSVIIQNDDIRISNSTINFINSSGAIKRGGVGDGLDNVLSFTSQGIIIGAYSGSYVNELSILTRYINIGSSYGGSDYNQIKFTGRIGFFGTSPQYQKDVYYAANDTNAELRTRLNTLIQRLGEYGLIYPRN